MESSNRIEELSNIAFIKHLKENPDSACIIRSDFIRDFTELVIKECLVQVRDEVQYEHDWKLADTISNRVLKHFGVEE